LDKINNTWAEKDSLNQEILVKTEEKVEIYKVDNEVLRKENKKLKTKNTLIFDSNNNSIKDFFNFLLCLFI
jgi:hypothetical protein